MWKVNAQCIMSCTPLQIREKNDRLQQRKLSAMFAAAPRGAAALDAVAADSLAMDMEARSHCLVCHSCPEPLQPLVLSYARQHSA